MTKAKTFVLLLAVVGLCAGSALGQAAKTVMHTVRYEIARDNGPDAWGVAGPPGPPENFHNWNRNQGANSWLRIKSFEYTYHGDWDTAAMQADIDPGGDLIGPHAGTYGWGSYSPVYSLSIMPIVGGGWPDVTPAEIHISCVWSENDWVEGTGTNWENYNWLNPMGTWAATYLNAQDHPIGGAELPWSFPGGGTGANAPYPLDVDCAFLGTFLTHGDVRDDWSPGTSETKTPTNSTDLIGGLADEGSYVTADLDQAIIDDMLQNVNNRGLALWNLTQTDNKNMYSDDQNQTQWPYIEARIEVCSGDANLDQAVDGLDYVSWSNNYNLPATWQTGDFNDDQIADGLDYVVWSNSYQQSCPGVPGAVPEPATMALLAIGGLAVLKRRRRS